MINNISRKSLRGNSEELRFEIHDLLRGSARAEVELFCYIELLFLKYLCDNYDLLIEKNEVNTNEGETNKNCYKHNIAIIPEGCDWSSIVLANNKSDGFKEITTILHRIEDENTIIDGIFLDLISQLQLKHNIKIKDFITLLSEYRFVEDTDDKIFSGFLDVIIEDFFLQSGKDGGLYCTPLTIRKVLIKAIAPSNGIVYDPFCGTAGLLEESFLSATNHNKRSGIVLLGQEVNNRVRNIARIRLISLGVQYDLGYTAKDVFFEDLHSNVKADYIVSNPPFNVCNKEIVNPENDKYWIYGVPGERNCNFGWVQYMLYHLSDKGKMAIILPLGTLFSSGDNDIRKGIVNSGVLESIILLPTQLMPGTSIPIVMWVFDKAKINTNTEHNVLFFDASRFGVKHGYSKILSEKECERIAIALNKYRNGDAIDESEVCAIASISEIAEQEYNLSPRLFIKETFDEQLAGNYRRLGEIARAINRPVNKKVFETFENCVYIPTVGKSEVVTDQNEFKIKSHNYIQVVLNNTENNEYVAFFYNTNRGKSLREIYSTGSVIMHLNKDSVARLPVIIPSEDEQKKIVEGVDYIQNLELDIMKLKKSLYSTPKAYQSILKKAKTINNTSDSFEKWIEELPYPLGTILRKYLVDSSFADKQDSLFNFFEAYDLFNAMILTSVVANNRNIFKEKKTFTGLKADYYKAASFGSWTMLNKTIAKTIHHMLKEDESREALFQCFKTNDRCLIELFCNKKILDVLEKVQHYRNLWKGHGSIRTVETDEEHVRKLHNVLMILQNNMQDLFERVRLVRCVNIKYSNRKFTHTIELLCGSNPLFKKISYTAEEPLDDQKLFLLMGSDDSAIELLPWIKFGNAPSEDKSACYFYNRIDNGKTRYVSYHFAGKPENIEDSCSAFDEFEKLLQFTTGEVE